MKVFYQYTKGDDRILAIYQAPNLIEEGYTERVLYKAENNEQKYDVHELSTRTSFSKMLLGKQE